MGKKENFLAKTWVKSNYFFSDSKKDFTLTEKKMNDLIGKTISVGPFYYYVLNFCNFPEVIMEQKNQSLFLSNR